MDLFTPLLPGAAASGGGGITATVATTLDAFTTAGAATVAIGATVAATPGAFTTSATATVTTLPGEDGTAGSDGFIFYWEL